MRTKLLLQALLLALAISPALCQTGPATLTAANQMKKGWMPGGWGSYRFVIKNTSSADATVEKWTAHWEAAGKPMGDSWGDAINQVIAAGKEQSRDEVGELPEDVYRAAKPGAPVMVGSFTVRQGDRTYDLPYRIEVPGAFLPEPLKLVRGKTAGI